MPPDPTTQRPCYAWLWKDATLADAKLRLWSVPWHTTLYVHRVVLAANSEYFKARVLRWSGNKPPDAAVLSERRLVHLSTSLPCWDETFDSPAECDVAGLVLRCMYEGRLVDEQQDALTLARVCRVAERWAFSSLTRCCLLQLSALPASQLPVTQLLPVLETLPDLSGLQPEHDKWLDRAPCIVAASLPACAAYAQGRLPALAWFQIPGAATAEVAVAASCAMDMTGVLNKDKAPAAWTAAPRTKLDPAELLRRTTIRWDIPRQRLATLLASKDLTAKVASEPVYTAGAGWRVYVDLNKGKDKKDFTLGCWGQVVAYAECREHSLGAKLPFCTPIRYTITNSTWLKSGFDSW
ncbi:hypothetical protein HaLaN_29289 [Haematococcus lacustris]|uniref:BTB domain-containing protein n=1 Tax=Haematococcus lacustris TaxID=44745 RepID=A0A6A0ADN3_HAELA|nr:hypothetical protein HaLaN_29289 [Haematococcus lacustris]